MCKLSDLHTQSFGRGVLYRMVDYVHLFLSEHLVHVPVDDTVAVTRGPALRVNEFVKECDLQKNRSTELQAQLTSSEDKLCHFKVAFISKKYHSFP